MKTQTTDFRFCLPRGDIADYSIVFGRLIVTRATGVNKLAVEVLRFDKRYFTFLDIFGFDLEAEF